jgi:ABC-type transporter Mla MlaB component
MNAEKEGALMPNDPEPVLGYADVTRAGDHWELRLSGEVSFEMGARLDDVRRELGSAGGSVDVDLGAVRFVDSVGIAFLAQLARQSEGLVTVRHANGLPRATLMVSGLNRVLTMVDDTDAEVG